MTPSPTLAPERDRHGLPFAEFVALIAAIIAVNALGVDIMLPALGMIGRDLNVAIENHQQLVVAVYVGAFGVGQIIWGPLADRFGRRAILLGSMACYAAMSFLAAMAGSFELLLAARAMQGLSSASTRVLSASIIRDCYAGRRMAKVSSIAFMIFLAVPILAPTIGQLILFVLPWHGIFYLLGLYSLAVALWAWLRLPETLDPANRREVNPRAMLAAARFFAANRQSVCYTVALGCLYGGLLSFINSSQQIFMHAFHAPEIFTICFGITASFMVVAALLNARFVERYGMRMISHLALVSLIVIAVVHAGIALAGLDSLPLFILLNGLCFFLYGLGGSNFGALSMDPMGHIAGTAASIQGFMSTLIATSLSIVVGQHFDGTIVPLTLGWVGAATIALGVILFAEKGRLFRPGT